jgi:alpha-L-rhamnosidase
MNRTHPKFLVLALILGAFAVARPASAQSQADALEQGFQNPPDSAKPRTWWHWTGGNVTKEGITKDLE